MEREEILHSVRLGALILVSTLTGCATLHGESGQSVAGLGGGSKALSLSDPAAHNIEHSAASQWATHEYSYRGGRDPKTGLAKIQM
jgi:hypothetical protein